jgi:Ca2+-binding RTX toxin-like protein
MIGGIGSDTYTVDDAGDRIIEFDNEGIDLVRSEVSFGLSSNVEKLVLTGGAAIDGTGNGASNTMTGNAAANMLLGLGGDDRLDGGAGADRLIGGSGNDILIGGAGDDQAWFEGAFSNYSINAAAGTVSSALEGLDTLSGVEQLQFADGTYNWSTGVFTSGPGWTDLGHF